MQFTTARVRGHLTLTRRLSANIAYYAIQYKGHFSGDGGATWHDSTHNYNTPRIALSLRPNADTAWRLALGGSIAPPFLSLISSPGGQPSPNTVPATSYTQNINNGQIAPETAFGYDFGFDKRIKNSTSISVDAYLTNLHNEFLPQTYQQGTYAPTTGAQAGVPLPLYISQVANLGYARYEGIEAAVERAPLVGLGFRIQGTLQRAFPYNLPKGFYDTAAGPYTTNLGVLPNVNFQQSGIGFNALTGNAMPYAMGYGEINYRTSRGNYFNAGVQYFGHNNAYSRPPFAVLSASWRVPLQKNTTLQISGDNLTGAYGNSWTDFAGLPVPLAHGAQTPTTGYLGATSGGNYGPATFRVLLTTQLGP